MIDSDEDDPYFAPLDELRVAGHIFVFGHVDNEWYITVIKPQTGEQTVELIRDVLTDEHAARAKWARLKDNPAATIVAAQLGVLE